MRLWFKIKRRFKHEFKERLYLPVLARNKQKIFCIGQNKTGTTSLFKTFKELNYVTATETESAKQLDNYINKDFGKIVKYCRRAQVFEDIPFSLPDTYKFLDEAYPGSKFILTIRKDSEIWYNSLVNFLSKLIGKGNLPTAQNFRNAKYIQKGWVWKLFREIYSTPQDDLLNKEMLIKKYEDHNRNVIEYFKGRDCLLVLNLEEEGAFEKFCQFLNITTHLKRFPWVHKTSTMEIRT